MGMFRKWILPGIRGILWVSAAAACGWALLYWAGDLAALIAGQLGVEEELAQQIAQALMQLKVGQILPPWLGILLLGGGLGILARQLKRRGRKGLVITGSILLFLPVAVAALWLTKVNGIYLGAVLRQALMLLKGLV